MPRLELNGKEVSFREGETLLQIAWREGYRIPVFCYHPSLGDAVASCRICLVEVEMQGRTRLLPACSTQAQEGMRVQTETETVLENVRKGTLEFLLANHPLECPVCDAGGECDLQELTLRWGPDRSTYPFPRRELPRHRPGPFMELYPNRCILCDRCVRFYQNIAAGGDWGAFENGWWGQVGPVQDAILQSIYSGNMVEICPLGAITGRDYRFRARPWEMKATTTVSPHFSTGDVVHVYTRKTGEMSRGPFQEGGRRGELHEILRVYAAHCRETNEFWLDDASRFAFDFVQAKDRHRTPLLRKGNNLEPVFWEQALEEVAHRLHALDGQEIGFLTLGRGTLEGAYLFARLARRVLRSANLDHRRPEAATTARDPAYHALGASASPDTLDVVDQVERIWIWHTPILNRWPLLGIRLVRARRKGTRIQNWTPYPGETLPWDPESLTLHPERELEEALRWVERWRTDLERTSTPTLLILHDALPEKVQTALLSLKGWFPHLHVLYLRHAPNGQGFVDMGVHPGLLDAHRPAPRPGKGAGEILTAILEGTIRSLVLWNVDPLVEYPQRDLWEEALSRLDFLVVVSSHPSPVDAYAHAILPEAVPYEIEGTLVNTTGYLLPFHAALPPLGLSLPDHTIWQKLLQTLGDPVGASLEEIWEHIRQDHPLYAEVSREPEKVEEPYPEDIPTLRYFKTRWVPDRLTYPFLPRKIQLPEETDTSTTAEAYLLVVEDLLWKANPWIWSGELIQRAVGELNLRSVVEMHPETGASLDLEEGDWVELIAGERRVRVRVRWNSALPEKMLRAYRGFYDQEINRLLDARGRARVQLRPIEQGVKG